MHYYRRHLGDYAKDAGHLSLLEHGVYTLLLDRYYSTERPLSTAEAIKVCHARSAEEVAAVESVLAEFFAETEPGWASKRADEEIEAFHGKAAKAAESAGRRWNNANAMRTHMPTHPKGNANAYANASERQCQLDANQEPITNNQEKAMPRPAKRGTRLPPDWELTADRKASALTANPACNPEAESAKFRDYWAAKAGKDGVKLDWEATWRNWCRNVRGATPLRPEPVVNRDGVSPRITDPAESARREREALAEMNRQFAKLGLDIPKP